MENILTMALGVRWSLGIETKFNDFHFEIPYK